MLRQYIQNKIIYYIVWLFIVLILFFLKIIFNLNLLITATIILTSFITITIFLIINYVIIRKNFFKIKMKLSVIEKSELITYYFERPTHYESGYMYDMLEIISESLYTKNKENIDNQLEYQEYLLLFIHDLKLPLQNLKLISTKEEQTEILIMENLIDNLLNFSKISFKSIDLKIKKVNIEEVLNRVIKNNFNLIMEKKIKLEVEYNEMIIATDYYWLEFVFKQLINNSINYCENKIIIQVIDFEKKIEIIISNNGELIRNDELELIFEKGYTGSNAANNATGFGLYYSKIICEKLNFNLIATTNEELNKFKISFRK